MSAEQRAAQQAEPGMSIGAVFRGSATMLTVVVVFTGICVCTELFVNQISLEQTFRPSDVADIFAYHLPLFFLVTLGATMVLRLTSPGRATDAAWIGALVSIVICSSVVYPKAADVMASRLGSAAVPLTVVGLLALCGAGLLVIARARRVDRWGGALALALSVAALVVTIAFLKVNDADPRSVFSMELLAVDFVLLGVIPTGFVTLAWLCRTTERFNVVALIATTLFVFLAFRGAEPRPVGAEPRTTGMNVILICIDTLRADRLSVYGYPEETSPRLAELARQGTVFERAIAASNWTKPSVASLLTSREATLHKVNRYESGLSPELLTAAEIFKRNGYNTLGVVSNLQLNSFFGFDQGFEKYIELHELPVAYVSALTQSWAGPFLHWVNGGPQEPEDVNEATSAKFVNRAVMQLLDGRREPFFLYAHYVDPHQPYDPPEEHDVLFNPSRSRSYKYEMVQNGIDIGDEGFHALERRYLAEIHYTDKMLGELFDRLKEMELLSNTVIALVADHGEAFGEHSDFGHGHTLYDEQVRVPWLLWGPGVPKDKRISEPVSLLDVLPTLLSYAGLEKPMELRGQDLRALLEAQSGGVSERIVFTEKPGLYGALRGKGWKLIETTKLGAESLGTVNHAHLEAVEFYDLDEDPGERLNIASKIAPQHLASLLEALADRRADLGDAGHEGKDVDIDARTREALEALGYVE